MDQNEDRDYFEDLVSACIASFGVVLSDKLALDANGVIGKQRVLVMDNDRYQRETRKLRARQTITELEEIQGLLGNIDGKDEDEEEPDDGDAPEEIQPEEIGPDPMEEYRKLEREMLASIDAHAPDDPDYDIRDPEAWDRKRAEKRAAVEKELAGAKRRAEKEARARKKAAEERAKSSKKTTTASASTRKTKRFDKSVIEMRLKLLQTRRGILDAQQGEEEREGDALNIFFIPVTAEEFAAIETVEVSKGTAGADLDPDSDPAAKALGQGMTEEVNKRKLNTGVGYHYERINGESVMVED